MAVFLTSRLVLDEVFSLWVSQSLFPERGSVSHSAFIDTRGCQGEPVLKSRMFCVGFNEITWENVCEVVLGLGTGKAWL